MAIPQVVLNRLKEFEGTVAHMYLDRNKKVTIGVGHLISTADAAVALLLINKKTLLAATEEEKKQEWKQIKAHPPGKGPKFYEKFTKLMLQEEKIETLFQEDLKPLEDQLRNIYPDYDNFPGVVKEGLLDMIFNLGQTKLRKDFPSFNYAVQTQNWSKAAEECRRKGIQSNRNRVIRSLFESLSSSLWSLVEALQQEEKPRMFFLPVGSTPPEGVSSPGTAPSVYTLSEQYANDFTNSQTTAVTLKIQIRPPIPVFVDEDGLPDPAIRLYAMIGGQLRFQPANEVVSKKDRLILRTPCLARTFLNAPWWERWVEAGCIPEEIIYENIDRASLQNVLQGTQVATGSSRSTLAALRFPLGVTQDNKSAFIDNFLAGQTGYELAARAGAYLGCAGLMDEANPLSDRLLQLQVYYYDHSEDNPHPMNPREMFYLLFGNDSREARNHPLLRRMQQQGEQQSTVHPESKRMILRPPLRTWKRVVWEAEQEIDKHAHNWAQGTGVLGSTRLFNSHRRGQRTYNRGDYQSSYKCNLFVSDICLRAGFRINVHPVDITAWHYLDANSYSNLAYQEKGTKDRIPLMGRGQDSGVIWGWNIENWLRSQTPDDRQHWLNQAMTREGRCFILAGARPRKFRNYNLPNNVHGIADCSTSLRPNGVGHIVIVQEVLGQPMLVNTVGEGYQSIWVRSLEASGSGAAQQEFKAELGGMPSSADSSVGFIRLQLIELHPGKDPDTLQGLRDLNVENINRNLLNTANEAATDTQLTHKPDGTPRASGHCCRDRHPTSPVPIEVNC